MTRIVFVDLETTGVHADRIAWEIGLIVRESDRADVEHQMFVQVSDLDLGNAQPAAFNMNRFYDRHPEMGGTLSRSRVMTEYDAMWWVHQVTRGAVLVGHNVIFDEATLNARMRYQGLCPAWAYSVVEVSSLAAGFLVGRGLSISSPPWSSKYIVEQMGLPATPDEDLHTAIGDARQVKAVFDAVATPSETLDFAERPTMRGVLIDHANGDHDNGRPPNPNCADCVAQGRFPHLPLTRSVDLREQSEIRRGHDEGLHDPANGHTRNADCGACLIEGTPGSPS